MSVELGSTPKLCEIARASSEHHPMLEALSLASAAKIRLNWLKCERGGPVTCTTLFLVIFLAVGGCAVGPEIVAGGESAVSIKAGPLANAHRLADRHCGEFGKRAELIGSKQLGPSSTKRLYAFNCVT